MDYIDIYNDFEAGGQNVNVRIGRARAARSQACQKFRFSYFAEK